MTFFTQKTEPKPGGYREMWHIAAPLILSMGSFTIMQFTDRIFLSRYSHVALQAALPAGVLAHALVCLFQATAGYSGTFAAHYHGAKQATHGVHSAIQGLWMALLSWPLIALLLPAGLWIMSLSNHAPEVFAAEKSYFTILMLTGVVVPLNATIGSYFTGMGRTRVNLVASVIGSALNILLDYLFIFGIWVFPEMGIAGAAYATAASSLVSALIQLTFFFRSADWRAYLAHPLTTSGRTRTSRKWLPDGHLLYRMFRFGTPSGLQLFMDIGSISFFIMLTGQLGDLALTASNITFSINHLAFAPLLGISWAASAVVGKYQGARNTPAAVKAGNTAVRMGLIYMALIGATFLLFPRGYFRLFSPKDAAFTPDELLAVGRRMLVMITAWGVFDSISVILMGALKGAGDTHFIMRYMGIGSWLFFVPGACAVVWLLGGGILGLWAWFACYVCVFSIGIFIRWRSGRWKHIRLIHHEENFEEVLTV